MRLSNIKKVVVSAGLALGLVSGSIVAFGAPSQVITPSQSTADTAPRGVNSQVIEDGNTRIVIVGEGLTRGANKNHIIRATLESMHTGCSYKHTDQKSYFQQCNHFKCNKF